MKLELTVESRNAAMIETDHDTGEEIGPNRVHLAGLLRTAADAMSAGENRGTIIDYNGNPVGSWKLS